MSDGLRLRSNCTRALGCFMCDSLFLPNKHEDHSLRPAGVDLLCQTFFQSRCQTNNGVASSVPTTSTSRIKPHSSCSLDYHPPSCISARSSYPCCTRPSLPACAACGPVRCAPRGDAGDAIHQHFRQLALVSSRVLGLLLHLICFLNGCAHRLSLINRIFLGVSTSAKFPARAGRLHTAARPRRCFLIFLAPSKLLNHGVKKCFTYSTCPSWSDFFIFYLGLPPAASSAQ